MRSRVAARSGRTEAVAGFPGLAVGAFVGGDGGGEVGQAGDAGAQVFGHAVCGGVLKELGVQAAGEGLGDG